jgi:flavin-dependent dehydrogenase
MRISQRRRSENFDVVVAGAGPCGSVIAARLASGGMAVLLLEADDFRRPRVGEFLSPGVRSSLNALALLDPAWERSHRPVNEFASAWASSEAAARNYIFDAYGSGLVLDRARFDRELALAAVRRGARLATRARLHAVVRAGGGWEITFDKGGRQFEARCGFLIFCSGRRSRLPAGFAIRRQRLDRLVCLGLRASGYNGEAFPLVESYAHGWAYSTMLQSSELVIYLFADSDDQAGQRTSRFPSSLLRQLAKCPRTAARLIASTAAKASDISFFAADASSTLRRPATGPGWCLAGDCAQTVDPLSSAGIGCALRHAKLVSEALLKPGSASNPDLSGYASYLSNSYADYLDSRRRVYGSENRWMTNFWHSRGRTAGAN